MNKTTYGNPKRQL